MPIIRPVHLLELTVAPLMVPHVALRAETFVAVGAPERPLVAMDPLVDSQILLLRETFAAARERTTERLRPVMDMLVRLQANVSSESLAAALKRTSEHLVIVSLCLLLVVGLARIKHLRIVTAGMEALFSVLNCLIGDYAGADHLILIITARLKI